MIGYGAVRCVKGVIAITKPSGVAKDNCRIKKMQLIFARQKSFGMGVKMSRNISRVTMVCGGA